MTFYKIKEEEEKSVIEAKTKVFKNIYKDLHTKGEEKSVV